MHSKTDLSASVCMDALQVRTSLRGSTAVIAVRGEIDYGSAPVLDQALEGLPTGADSVLLDMAGVTFMDVAGLHFLQRLNAFGRRHRVPVETLNWGRQPRRVLEAAARTFTRAPEASLK
ncbi:STAS domain-containing protein [Streptomyces sp. ACA25]|uniref:STAS domain-containing protein n=1 Tax=Streptomyces sp. ACA25 TaxID=3022596 RepID=UPI002307E0AB|nr:STAS domain-containing protein [Streptomyces sp. ACA25]MDB1087776.1 STAS domain-containing protein [Streptomyces sp. ACA25]